MKLAALACALALYCSAACTSTNTTFVRTAQIRLEPDQSVYVAMPANGTFGDRVYASSGNATAQALFDAFLERTPTARLARSVEDREAALESAAKGGEAFIALPTILHWEDRATAWSGRPDRIRVNIEILDAKTRERVDSATIEGTSAVGTWANAHPQDLLKSPVRAFVASLYGVTDTSSDEAAEQARKKRESNSW